MTGANIIFINIVPLRFRGTGHVSKVTGVINAAAYVGGSLASALFGGVADRMGWGALNTLWCAIAVAGAVLAIAVAKKWMGFVRGEGGGGA